MRSPNAQRIYVQEVSARDGFQSEPKFVPTSDKIEYLNRLGRAGLAKIEVTSFTSPTAIPALADAESVCAGILRVARVRYTALVPNLRGCERALGAKLDEINVVVSASETHNMANLRMNCNESLRQIADIARHVRGSAGISASLSTAFGCPFEGDIPLDRVLEFVNGFEQMGISQVSLCDTTGMAHPVQVEQLFAVCRHRWPDVEFTAHFHNTRGMGLANVIAALDAGIDRFDASVGGLGGCPFAPGATGNICTEDMVNMLQLMGYETGVDLEELIQVATELPALVGHPIAGQLVKAGLCSRRHIPTHASHSSAPRPP